MIEDEHLGDGAYAHFDGHHVVLTANGSVHSNQATDRVALEPGALQNFLRWNARLQKAKHDFIHGKGEGNESTG